MPPEPIRIVVLKVATDLRGLAEAPILLLSFIPDRRTLRALLD